MHRKIISAVLILSVAFSVFGCSNRLAPETVPSEVATNPTTSAEPSETSESLLQTTESTEETHGPLSTAQVTDRIADIDGQLSVDGTNIVNSAGEVVQLKGMSTYALNMCPDMFNSDTVQTIAQDWGADVLRLAMTTKGDSDDYNVNPEKYFDMVCNITDLAIAQGMYVIIDWHILYDGDPNEFKDASIDFFSRISAIYGDTPNVMYEICNEPNGMCYDDDQREVDWDGCIKPYAEDVIDAIRENDPDNIIIVGTPNWSQDVDIASEDPIDGDNICYTCHFYAGSHGQELRDKIVTANDNGCCVFVTEWGTTNDTGKGMLYLDEAQQWLDFLDERNISWCNWSIGGAAAESSNALRFNSDVLTIEEKYAGHWPDEFISKSGLFVRAHLLGIEYIPTED
ncbi:MAG: glycoside hydrolase family 5 protein [Saccharofermentans sp.]|jgi:endoglucanase|nr:glycoside hydrolase family 5 protein [Mageeibacillus sp.]MCI1263335.1 glycoside hydrolase family 5 protein [Saccharofermentans sp.]MCI1275525.1 glycoside hydrolase family 5 protein [Saccharofermentans sp.]MCI1768995.1 glycoside hydrolase family 5 protein [Mageeibacillus sp.]MCI2043931.1 glycoside hydrolase family 5 protein [Mageeibacillus sp.]